MAEPLPVARGRLPAGSWDEARTVGTVTLAWDDRHRRRIRLATDQGGAVLLDLPQAVRLAEGDGLALDDGGVVRVVAAAEALLEVGGGTAGLVRLAYHLGNRHLPLEIGPEMLWTPEDHVIAEMVRGLGGAVRTVRRPFVPEAGAYGEHGMIHGHDHGHQEHDDDGGGHHHHGHGHSHGHDHHH